MGENRVVATESPTGSAEEIDESIHDWLLERLSAHLRISVQEVPPDAVFTDIGLSSVKAVELVVDIEERYGLELSPVLLYDYPSVTEVARMVTAKVDSGES